MLSTDIQLFIQRQLTDTILSFKMLELMFKNANADLKV